MDANRSYVILKVEIRLKRDCEQRQDRALIGTARSCNTRRPAAIIIEYFIKTMHKSKIRIY